MSVANRGLSLFNKVDRETSLCLAASGSIGARLQHAHGRDVAAAEKRRGRAGRVKRLATARGRTPPDRRYLVTVASTDKILVIDSAKARVTRAQRRVYTWAKVIPETIEVVKRKKDILEVPRLVMLTLTYKDAAGWATNDIRNYMLLLRAELKGKLLAYAWVLEIQKRGAPHYHILLYVRRGTYIPTPDKSGMWKKGSSQIETARTAYYIARYIGKEYQKEMLPGGARMFAVWVNKNIVGSDAYRLFKMSSLPGWFRAILDEAIAAGADIRPGGWRRAPGGGWCLKKTGEIYPSPWRVLFVETIYGRKISWVEN